jgi:hypothetical protein
MFSALVLMDAARRCMPVACCALNSCVQLLVQRVELKLDMSTMEG